MVEGFELWVWCLGKRGVFASIVGQGPSQLRIFRLRVLGQASGLKHFGDPSRRR